jgi:CBS domain-containing protein
MKVSNIMTQPPRTCTIDMDLTAASRRMAETGCGTLAILNHQARLAGILTDRDLALAIGNVRDPSRTKVTAVMSHPVHTCGPADDVRVALDRMAEFQVRRLPVVDETGNIAGMISIDDIVLWGVTGSSISVETLIAALRSVCSRSTTAATASTE